MCCENSALTCYEKNNWWAECKPTCTPGVDANDEPEFRTPWTCAILSSGTTTTTTRTMIVASICSDFKEDCRSTRCCKSQTSTCYKKSDWWAECKPACTPGIDLSDAPEYQTPWTCEVLPLRVSTTTTTSISLCSGRKEDCRATMCCSNSSLTCWEKNEWWAECKPACTPGIDENDDPAYQTPWSCNLLSVGGTRRLEEEVETGSFATLIGVGAGFAMSVSCFLWYHACFALLRQCSSLSRVSHDLRAIWPAWD